VVGEAEGSDTVTLEQDCIALFVVRDVRVVDGTIDLDSQTV
jgi:hypothetical protein